MPAATLFALALAADSLQDAAHIGSHSNPDSRASCCQLRTSVFHIEKLEQFFGGLSLPWCCDI
jgi:hypothetical protein